MIVDYNHECTRHIRLAAIGCGGHALRNIFPTLQYAPAALVAVCDLDADRAKAVGRQFGAKAYYTDYRELLESESPEAVIVVTSYDEAGMPRYPEIVQDVLAAGAHAWIEKPPAASEDQVLAMAQASQAANRHVFVGFKKMFFPANVHARNLMNEEGFGALTLITARYPERLPPLEERAHPVKMVGFLDHIMHPHSLLRYLAGPLESICVARNAQGGAVSQLYFQNGAVGSLLLSHGQSGLSPFERTELVGEGANIVVDNNSRVTYYPRACVAGCYGRAGSCYDTEGPAPRVWEPEFSLGQLYNKGLFLLGYAPEIRYFCQCVLEGRPPEWGNLDDALEMVRVYDAYRRPEGERVRLV